MNLTLPCALLQTSTDAEGQQDSEGDPPQADRMLDASGEELVFVDMDLLNYVPPRRRVGKVSVVLVSCAQDGGCCTTQYSLHSCRACACIHGLVLFESSCRIRCRLCTRQSCAAVTSEPLLCTAAEVYQCGRV